MKRGFASEMNSERWRVLHAATSADLCIRDVVSLWNKYSSCKASRWSTSGSRQRRNVTADEASYLAALKNWRGWEIRAQYHETGTSLSLIFSLGLVTEQVAYLQRSLESAVQLVGHSPFGMIRPLQSCLWKKLFSWRTSVSPDRFNFALCKPNVCCDQKV
jgi:hypothetical protein